jgi:hypothetical protein
MYKILYTTSNCKTFMTVHTLRTTTIICNLSKPFLLYIYHLSIMFLKNIDLLDTANVIIWYCKKYSKYFMIPWVPMIFTTFQFIILAQYMQHHKIRLIVPQNLSRNKLLKCNIQHEHQNFPFSKKLYITTQV